MKPHALREFVDSKNTKRTEVRLREKWRVARYHTLANDGGTKPLLPYSCCSTATNDHESASLVDFRSRQWVSYARPGPRAAPAATGSPILIQLPAPTRPAGSLAAESGRPGPFGLSLDWPGKATTGISAAGWIATALAGAALFTFARWAESKRPSRVSARTARLPADWPGPRAERDRQRKRGAGGWVSSFMVLTSVLHFQNAGLPSRQPSGPRLACRMNSREVGGFST